MASSARGAEEEVFETPDVGEDGLEQHSEGEIPNPTLSKTGNKVPDAEVVESFVPPQAAFEVFMGRTYAGAREDMSDVVGAAASSSSSAGGAVYEGEGYHRPLAGAPPPGEGGGEVETAAGVRGGGGSGPRRRTGESPLQRLVRLREETAMLAEDLEEMSKARRTDRAGDAEGAQESEGGAAAGGYSLWSAMAKETEALKRQLALLSGDPRFKHIISSTPATGRDQDVLQQRLSEGVVRALENLREPAGDPAAEAATAPQTAAARGGNGSVTYELFLNDASEARRRFGPAGGGGGEGGGIPSAEARIAALEKALGGGGEGAAGVVDAGKAGEVAGPLAEVVASLEKRVSVLEPGRLDVLRQKAQLAKSELDALAKSRSAPASGSASSSSSARGKKVEEAFATLENWQGIAAGLPALVDRLQALETLHLASASFAQRLEQVETGQTELEGVLKCTNEGLLDTRKSSAENVSIVNENVKLEDGIGGLHAISGNIFV
ncbi:conserved unknown protein [Ectocarpus siliculosus]|uniref:Uncharacterized protein n=1 Tax=Ectocarpus siliculosus TaxID=2880 RepID=D7FZ68_ECTSI|nr:conserved unknown protein [Ectocarpus siliculosus]|eukprot:CBJ32685.1 conserved unknown protein [Ectocarpus siliculosus]